MEHLSSNTEPQNKQFPEGEEKLNCPWNVSPPILHCTARTVQGLAVSEGKYLQSTKKSEYKQPSQTRGDGSGSPGGFMSNLQVQAELMNTTLQSVSYLDREDIIDPVGESQVCVTFRCSSAPSSWSQTLSSSRRLEAPTRTSTPPIAASFLFMASSSSSCPSDFLNETLGMNFLPSCS